MRLLDMIRARFVPKGVVEAGVPNESRPDALHFDPNVVSFHLTAFPQLPQDAAMVEQILGFLTHPLSLQTGARAGAVRLAAERDMDAESVRRLLDVLLAELSRALYVEAAAARSGVLGIRLLPEAGVEDDAVLALTRRDDHGLGIGVYPVTAVPANPRAGQRAGFYVRVVQAPGGA